MAPEHTEKGTHCDLQTIFFSGSPGKLYPLYNACFVGSCLSLHRCTPVTDTLSLLGSAFPSAEASPSQISENSSFLRSTVKDLDFTLIILLSQNGPDEHCGPRTQD